MDTYARIIAIDGPAGAGKSTIAKKVAKKIGFSYLDTGAMYRVVTLKALRENLPFTNENALYECAKNTAIRFEECPDSVLPRVFLGQEDVTDAIRSPDVSRNVSDVAKSPKVREVMTQSQREIGSRGKWVVDGRDIGTVVFPTARVKVFLTASIAERAQRRLKDLQKQGFHPELKTLEGEIARRDDIDSTRDVAPLKQAEEAYLLDSTSLDINQVVKKIIEFASSKDESILSEERMENINNSQVAEKDKAKGKVEAEEAPMTMEDFEKELSGDFHTVRSGAIVTGTVIDMTPTEIFVDLGYKTDGAIPAEECQEAIKAGLKKGDKIRVFVKSVDDKHGQMHLSHRRACEIDAWDLIQNAFRNKTPIEGLLKDRIKGGYDVDIGGVRAFLPQSQLSHGKNLKECMGKPYPMIVTECDRKRKNVVVSERMVVEELRNVRRDEIFGKHQQGDMIKGTVSRIVEYGAFIDLGDGVEGLIHRNDLSWSVIANPREIVQPGMEIEAKILKMDHEKGKISLGLKQKREDPWATIQERFEVGRRYEGKVKNLMDFGAFVELEEGIEGLVHISDLSWARNVRHPSDIVKSGDVIKVLVKEIDKDKKRISLSYKETQPHPWDNIQERFKVGDMVTGKVNNMTDFGAFIEIEEGVEGLLHVSDMDWVKKISHPKEVLEKGQEVKVKVLNIDTGNRRLSLGLKQTLTDPWENLESQHQIGDTVNGVVKSLVSYGAFVQLPSGIEGLLHISEFSWNNDVKDPAEVLKIGDQVTVSVFEIDKQKQKLGLSLRRISEDPWKGIERRFPSNSLQTGKVLSLENSGAVVELAPGVEGFVHISQISQNRVQHPNEALKEGDTVTFKVLEIDRKNRRLKLSIKEAAQDHEAHELRKFQSQSSSGFSDTIGDLLRDQLQSFKNQLNDDNDK